MGAFLDLVAADQVGHVTAAIERTISRSFAEDRSRATADEIRRRFAICERFVRRLRGDLGWSLARVADALPHCLRSELDGVPWDPDARAIWTPTGRTN